MRLSVDSSLAEEMTSTPLSLEQLPLEVITNILKWLPLESLYVLERTSKPLRTAVLFNPFLKYHATAWLNPHDRQNAFERRSFSDPLSHHFRHTVHHGWDHVMITLHGEASEVIAFWRFRETGTIAGRDRMNRRLLPTNLAHHPAVYPPLQKMILRVHDGARFQKQKEVEGKDGGSVTFEDICPCLNDDEKYHIYLGFTVEITWYGNNVFKVVKTGRGGIFERISLGIHCGNFVKI
jgi:hypothetical protein